MSRVRFLDNVPVTAYQPQSGSGFGPNLSSSYAITASHALSGNGFFSGIFSGDGNGLTNLSGAGLNNTIQFNNNGILDGDPTLIFNTSSKTLETSRIIITGSSANLFLIKNSQNEPILNVQQDGIVVFQTQSVNLNNPAPAGGIYFTSNSMFIGIE